MRFGLEFGSYPAELDTAEVCEQLSLRAQVAYKNDFEALFVAQHYLTGRMTAILRCSIAEGVPSGAVSKRCAPDDSEYRAVFNPDGRISIIGQILDESEHRYHHDAFRRLSI